MALFRRSFPEATVVHHHTTKFKGQPIRLFPDIVDWEPFAYWANMADFLGRYRSHITDFPVNSAVGPYAFLTPAPERVVYWTSVLEGLNDKPKIGLLWKSLIKHSRRDRYYSPFEQWEGVLRTEGVQFVNLQYGDTTEEIELAKAAGFDIWTPPGIDLKMDLDDLAALSVAMDCIICPANATSNIAGACGATVWMISPGKPWTSLGTDYFPWYPSTRLFLNASLLDWTPVMGEVKAALSETFASQNG